MRLADKPKNRAQWSPIVENHGCQVGRLELDSASDAVTFYLKIRLFNVQNILMSMDQDNAVVLLGIVITGRGTAHQ